MFASFLKSLAAVTIFGCSAAALASSSGSITVGKFSYTLVDLNPYDGITPSLQFIPNGDGWGNGGVSGSYQSALGWDVIHDAGLGINTLGISHTNPINGIEIKGYVGHRQRPETHFIQLIGNTPPDDTSGYLYGHASTGNLHFVLSPGTSVTFHVPVRTSVFISDLPGVEQGVSTVTWAPIWINGDEYPNSHWQSFDDPTPVRLNLIDILNPTYANNSTESVPGWISMTTFLWVDSSGISPVPEPQTYATLLVGICVVARRRSRTPTGGA